MQELFDIVANYVETFKKGQIKGEPHIFIPLVVRKGFDML